jgi:hypothetical protein
MIVAARARIAILSAFACLTEAGTRCCRRQRSDSIHRNA